MMPAYGQGEKGTRSWMTGSLVPGVTAPLQRHHEVRLRGSAGDDHPRLRRQFDAELDAHPVRGLGKVPQFLPDRGGDGTDPVEGLLKALLGDSRHLPGSRDPNDAVRLLRHLDPDGLTAVDRNLDHI